MPTMVEYLPVVPNHKLTLIMFSTITLSQSAVLMPSTHRTHNLGIISFKETQERDRRSVEQSQVEKKRKKPHDIQDNKKTTGERV